MKPSCFIEKIAPGAVSTMKSSGIPASLTIAQAALESGWGEHAPGNNLFGIKANGWKGKLCYINTREYVGGKYKTVRCALRAYSSWAESVKDHAAFLTGSKRYENIIGVTDYEEDCRRIKADGYATAPDYAEILAGIIRKYRLYDYDRLPALNCVDLPSAGETYTGDIRVCGWGMVDGGIKNVDVYYDDNRGLAHLGKFYDRQDVRRIINPFGFYRNAGDNGYSVVLKNGTFTKGKHTIHVAVIGNNGSVKWVSKDFYVA